MKLDLLKFIIFRNFNALIGLMFFCSYGYSQSLYIGNNSEFYLVAGTAFTTNNTVVSVDGTGVFSVEAGSNWGSTQEYVDGKVNANGTGLTLFPTGDNGVYAPVSLDHTGNASAIYANEAPTGGSNGVNVDDVADVEYWELTGTAVATLPYNDNSDISTLVANNGGSLNAVSIVGLNSGVWDLISATNTSVVNGDLLNGTVSSDNLNPSNLDAFSQFTFGIDHQIVLGLDDLFLTTGITLVSNPVKSDESGIRFRVTGELVDLKASVYDINGRMVKYFDEVNLNSGEGNLSKSNLRSGLYFVRFEHDGKQGVKKILIE